MSNSLKDQLLALGLASKKAESRPKKQRNTQPEISLDQAYRVRSKDDRRQKEAVVAHKREQERQRNRRPNAEPEPVEKDW